MTAFDSANSVPTLTADQLDAIRAAVFGRARATGVHPSYLWPALRERFGVRNYYRIPAAQFEEAIHFINGYTLPAAALKQKAHTVAASPVEAAPAKTKRIAAEAAPAPVAVKRAKEAPRASDIVKAYLDSPERQPGKGSAASTPLKARIYDLQKRVSAAADMLLDLLDDMEQMSGASPFQL